MDAYAVTGNFVRDEMQKIKKQASISYTLVWLGRGRDLFSPPKLQVRRMEMSNVIGSRVRYGEAFWRAHHRRIRAEEI
jgi:hypothetical protein